MEDTALQRRLDAALLLLLANFSLLLAIGFQYAREAAVGVVALVLLVGYGFLKGDGGSAHDR